MRKFIVLFFSILSVFLISGCSNNISNNYLRVHIRANSNSEEDQNIKYFVKDAVVEYLSPHMTECKSKEQVIDIINKENDNIIKLINKILLENDYDYGCSIEINNEFFPTRTYGELTLNADYYDALIIKLGTGEGDNWWCVMYPNLCFNEPDNVVYKSKIMEIIQRLKG